MYYHIFIELKDKKKYTEYNLTKNESDIINEYVIPYLKGIDFFVGSTFVNKEKISNIFIKKTNDEIDEIKKNLQSKSSFIVYTREVTLKNSSIGENIIGDLIKKIKKESEIKERIGDEKRIPYANNKIFIVHGHDDEMKAKVTRFINQIGLIPIVLHEQASKGQTIIEKIDEYTDVRHGIVLYSPCDLGKSKNDTELKERARQNVIFEHGYLIGKLGKNKVTALNKGNIETPSDIGGIIYINYDTHDGWQIKLGKELKANGVEINLNNLF